MSEIKKFTERYEIIETRPFYMKPFGTITFNNQAKILVETKKAILIREKIQNNKELYSTVNYWIPKSVIIKREVVYPKYLQAYESYVKISKELGNSVDFTYEQYLELALKKEAENK